MSAPPVGVAETAADVVDKLVGSTRKLLNFLSWGKLALLTALIAVGLLTIVIWENRQPIYTSLTSGEKYSAYDGIPPLSTITTNFIQNVVDRQPNVIAVQVVEMDFRNNTRNTSFLYSKNDEITNEFQKYLTLKIGNPQLFATGQTDQNERLIKIMEQEFVCTPIPVNISEIIPSAPKHAKEICSISVPPRYGKMVGYINIWLEQPTTASTLVSYKSIARSISDEIYDRDVQKVKK